MKKSNIITIVIILGVLVLAYFILNKPIAPVTSEEVAKCIGDNSLLYTQLGCHACEKQEELFGETYQYLNTIDCWFERDKCGGVTATPTWIINGETIQGVQSVEKLQELTGC